MNPTITDTMDVSNCTRVQLTSWLRRTAVVCFSMLAFLFVGQQEANAQCTFTSPLTGPTTINLPLGAACTASASGSNFIIANSCGVGALMASGTGNAGAIVDLSPEAYTGADIGANPYDLVFDDGDNTYTAGTDTFVAVTINVVDDAAPIWDQAAFQDSLFIDPADTLYQCGEPMPTDADFIAASAFFVTDCDPGLVVTVLQRDTVIGVGATVCTDSVKVELKAEDASGNADSIWVFFIVTDTLEPVSGIVAGTTGYGITATGTKRWDRVIHCGYPSSDTVWNANDTAFFMSNQLDPSTCFSNHDTILDMVWNVPTVTLPACDTFTAPDGTVYNSVVKIDSIFWSVTDSCGNNTQDNPDTLIVFTVDQTAPMFYTALGDTISEDTVCGFTEDDCLGMVTFTFDDGDASADGIGIVDSCTAFANIFVVRDSAGTVVDSALTGDASDPANLSGDYPMGETVVTYTAYDECGNSAMYVVRVIVIDTTPPIPDGTMCGLDTTVSTGIAGCNALFTWVLPTAADSCSPTGAVPVDSIAAIGPDGNPFAGITVTGASAIGLFDVGVTSVTYYFADMAIDKDGNPAPNVDSCMMTITVMDSAGPVAVCQDVTVTLDATGNAMLEATSVDAGSYDNCFVDTMYLTKDAFDCTMVGLDSTMLVVVDSSGNMDTCSAYVTVVDDIRPDVSCLAVDLFVSDAAVMDSVTLTDVIGSVYDNCTIDTIVMTGQTKFGCADLGTHNVEVVVTDASGLTDTCYATVTVADTTAPALTISALAITTNVTTCSGVATWTVATDDLACSDPVNVVSSHTSGSTFPVGTTGVTVTATDASGNSTDTTFSVVVSDGIAPVIAPIADQTLLFSAMPNCNSVPDYTGLAIASDNCGIIDTVIQTPAPYDVFAAAPAHGGTATITMCAWSGGMDSCVTFDVTFQDDVAPIFTDCPTDTTLNITDNAMCSMVVAFAATATDSCAPVTPVADMPSGSTFPVGTTPVTYTAVDAAGNTATCVFNVTVEDTIAPTFTPYADIAVNADAGFCAATVTWAAPAPMDCSMPVTTVATHTSGDVFPVGNTSVVYTYTDAEGNASQDTFMITVSDGVAPVAECEDVTVQLGAMGYGVVTFGDINDGSADNCGLDSMWVVPDTFRCADLGMTTATLFVRDAAGAVSMCTANVTVEDVIAPTAACMPATVYLDAAGMGSITIADVDGGSTDNTTCYEIEIDNDMFDCSNLGANDVTLTITDSAGLSASCVAVVTVMDTLAPTIACVAAASPLVTSAIPGDCLAEASWNHPTAMDNCNIDAINFYMDGVLVGDVFAMAGDSTGAVLPIGVTMIKYVAVDTSGNTDSCMFNIIVNDDEMPVLNECVPVIVGFDSLIAPMTLVDFVSTSTAFPTGWSEARGASWTKDDFAGVSVTGYNAARMNIYFAQDDILATPMLTVDGSETVTFDHSLNPWGSALQGTFGVDDLIAVVVSTDGGATWPVANRLATWSAGTEPAAAGQTEMLSLAGYSGNIMVGFHAIRISNVSAPDIEWYVTNVSVSPNSDPTVDSLITPVFGPNVLDDTLYTSMTTPVGVCAADYVWNHFTFADNCPLGGSLELFIQYADGSTAGPTDVTAMSGMATADLFPVGVNNVTYTITDSAGNTNPCGFSITVIDDEGPMVTGDPFTTCFVPGPQVSSPSCGDTVQLLNLPNSCENNFAWVRPSPGDYTDACGGAGSIASITETFSDAAVASSIAVSYPFGDGNIPCNHAVLKVPETDFPVGTTEITYTITDTSGNVTTCSFYVEVIDTEAPSIACPPDQVMNTVCDSIGIADFTGAGGVFVTDNCPNNITITQIPAAGTTLATIFGGTPTNGASTTITLVASDNIYGNTDTCTFLLTVYDTEDPIPTVGVAGSWLPADTVSTCGGAYILCPPTARTCTQDPIYGVPSASTTGMVPVNPAALPNTCYDVALGTYVITWTYTDALGNNSIQYQYLVVEDGSGAAFSPTFTSCPSDVMTTTAPGTCAAATVTGLGVTAMDNCPGTTISADIMYDGVTTTLPTSDVGPLWSFELGVTTVTYTVTDSDGNTDVCSFTVTVSDNIAPIVLACVYGSPSGLDNITEGESFDDCVQPAGWNSDDGTTLGSASAFTGSVAAEWDRTNPGGTTASNGNFDGCIASMIDNRGDGDAYIVSPALDLNGVTSSALSFDWQKEGATTGSGHDMMVDFWDGTTWVNVFSVEAGTAGILTQATGINNTWANGTGYTWNDHAGTITADPVAMGYTNSDFRMRFGAPDAGGAYVWGMGIDNFNFSGYNPALDFYTSNLISGTTTVDTSTNVVPAPADTSYANPAVVCGAEYIFTNPTVIENCEGATLEVTYTYPDGSTEVAALTPSTFDLTAVPPITYNHTTHFFPIGTTFMTFTATDAAGNVDSTSCGVSRVEVADTTAPTIACTSTANAPLLEVDFAAGITTPGWTRGQGLLSASTTLTGTASGWGTDGFANVGFTGAVNVNVWNTTSDEWFVSPTINIPAGSNYLLEFDHVVTDFANSNPTDNGTLGPDDLLAVVVSTDDGATWSDANIVASWTGTNFPDGVAERVAVSLAGYTGAVKIGFYGESTVSNEDYEWSIDNVALAELPDAADIVVVGTSTAGSGACAALYDVVSPAIDAGCGSADLILSVGGVLIDTVQPGATTQVSLGTGLSYITHTVVNAVGSEECTFYVNVVDDELPVAICDEIIVGLGASGTVTITDAMIANNINDGSYDNCGTIDSMWLSQNMFDCDDIGVNSVAFYVTDDNGNQNACVTTVTIQDNVTPTFNFPPAVMLTCGDDASVAALGGVTSTDNCGSAMISHVDGATTDACGSFVRTWSVSDPNFPLAGTTTYDQVITYTVPAPTWASALPAAAMAYSCDDVMTAPTALTANVGCGTESVAPVSATVTDACGNMTITNTWTPSADCAGNVLAPFVQVVTVTDTEAPTFSAASYDVTSYASDYAGGLLCAGNVAVSLPAGAVTDNCDAAPTVVFSTTGGQTPVGTSTATATATDACGNSASVTINITVIDDVSPVAICDDDITVVLNNAGTASITAADIDEGSYDACSAITMWLSKTDFDCNDAVNGTDTVILYVMDAAGNTNSCTSVITFQESVAPVAICQDITVAAGTVVTGADLNGGSTDNCTGSLTYMINGAASWTASCADVGTQSVTMTVTDGSGNTSTCTANVTVTAGALAASCVGTLTVAPGDVITTAMVDNGSTGCITGMSLSATSFSCTELGAQTVTLTVTDAGGNTDNCSVAVTVVDNSAPTAVAQDVTVMLDASGVATATAAMVDNGSADACGTVNLALSQTVFGCADVGANAVVLTATDGSGNATTATATVTVVDNMAPTVTCNDVTLQLAGGTASINATDVSSGASDNCGVASVSVDQSTFTAAGTYPVVVTVMDVNGNSTTCNANVTVESNVLTFIAGNVTGAPGSTVTLPVTIEGFIGISGFQYTISLANPAIGTITGVSSAIAPASTVTFLSNDVAGNWIVSWLGTPTTLTDGTTVVNVTVELAGGVCGGGTSDVMINGALVPVEATNAGGIMPAADVLTVAGSVGTVGGDTPLAGNIVKVIGAAIPVNAANVDVTVGATATDMTDVNGDYDFCLDGGLDYTVTPSKDVDYTSYVDITDLILIQQHILYIDTFNNYQRIAADASNDGIITTFDIVQIQQVLLGNSPSWTNTSWRFLPTNHGSLGTPPAAPNDQQWVPAGYDEHRDYTAFTATTDADFYGIKIGDVDGAGAPMLNGNDNTATDAELRTEGTLYFDLLDQEVKAGAEYDVTFRANDFRGILGYQLTLDFDADVLSFVGVETGALEGLNEGNFGLNYLEDGALTMVWADAYAADLNDNDVVFTLTFSAITNAGQLSDLFNVSDRFAVAKAQRVDGTAMDIDLEFNTEEEIATAIDDSEFTLYQNAPNPFREYTMISFNMPENGAGTLNIYDISGRLVTSLKGDYNAGYNEVTITRSDVPGTGAMYYQLTTENHTATKKMILVD